MLFGSPVHLCLANCRIAALLGRFPFVLVCFPRVDDLLDRLDGVPPQA